MTKTFLVRESFVTSVCPGAWQASTRRPRNREDGGNGKTQRNGATEQEQRRSFSSLLCLRCSASLCVYRFLRTLRSPPDALEQSCSPPRSSPDDPGGRPRPDLSDSRPFQRP